MPKYFFGAILPLDIPFSWIGFRNSKSENLPKAERDRKRGWEKI